MYISFQVFLSVIWSAGKLGVAYYDLETTEIFMMLDTVETEDFTILRKGTPVVKHKL